MALLGGRVAEEIRFGDVTTGASNDLERVTNMARAMVTEWGMSELMGPIRYGEREELVFLGRNISEHRNYSDKVAQQIDEEVRRIVDEAHVECHKLLQAHWDKMELLSQRLLEIETIDSENFQALMRGEDPFKDRDLDQNRLGQSKKPSAVAEDKLSDERKDSGLGLGSGTLPAPA